MRDHQERISTFVAGALAATILILSCSGGGGRSDAADASVQPPAEPPLTRDRFIRVRGTATVQPTGVNQVADAGAICPADTQLLSGSCTSATATNPAITLQESGFIDFANAWSCTYKNNGTQPVDVMATAICLKLAP